MQWEYMLHELHGDGLEQGVQQLNALGQSAWEVVSSIASPRKGFCFLVLKRPFVVTSSFGKRGG